MKAISPREKLHCTERGRESAQHAVFVPQEHHSSLAWNLRLGFGSVLRFNYRISTGFVSRIAVDLLMVNTNLNPMMMNIGPQTRQLAGYLSVVSLLSFEVRLATDTFAQYYMPRIIVRLVALYVRVL